MLYRILRQIAATLFKIYFGKIYLIDPEKVPLKGPVLLASNHPMAFAEACLLACFLERPLHFLVRGDVFKPGWRWFFRATNQIPIYRFRDGFSNMRRNVESFARAHEALRENKVILMFPEGNTRLQKKLSPLQKGAARLVFGAYTEKEVKEIRIVPVGVNYSDGRRFRSDALIKVGDPVDLQDYLDLYDKDVNEGVRSLTDDLYKSMLPLVIHLEMVEDEKLADRLFGFYEKLAKDPAWPVVDRNPLRFIREKKIAAQINRLAEPVKVDLYKLTNEPFLLSDKWSWQDYFILILVLPLALLGFILNAIPFYLAKYIADQKVRQIEFYTPVRMGLLLVFYLLWFVLAFVLLTIFLGWYALIAIWILPLSGYVTILWKEGYDRLNENGKVNPSIYLQIEKLLFDR